MFHLRRPAVLASGVALTAALTLVGGVGAAGAKTVHLATTAAAGAASSAKLGGSAVISNSLPAGYSIATSGTLTATNGVQTRGTVTCPGTLKPVGGGAYVASTSTLANLNSSFPVSKHTWAVDVNNASGADTTFQVYAVCIKRGNLAFTVNTNVFTAAANTQSSGTVGCPSGVVVGGGVLSSSGSTAVNINTLIPSGTSGWRADMNNATASANSFTVWAICRNTKPGGYSVQVGSAVDNPSGAQTRVQVACPGNSVPLSGGVFSSSGNTAVNLNESIPSGQTWLGYENNASAGDAAATPYAVCAGK
jgi:hypothetical protein